MPRPHRGSRRIGAFEFTGAHPATPPRTLRLEPSDWGYTELGRLLAFEWENHARASGALGTALPSWQDLRTRVFPFLIREGIKTPGDLQASALLNLERLFAAETRTVTGLSSIWSFLRNIEGLRPEVRRLVSARPALPFPDSDPSEAFPVKVYGDILRAAKSDVTAARADDAALLPTWRQSVAYYALLLVELGWSVDVLKSFSFDSDALVGVVRWSEDKEQPIRLRWYKKRGGARAVEVYASDGPFSAGALIRDLRDRTALARGTNEVRAAMVEWAETPWLCRAESGHGALPGVDDVAATFETSSPLRKWLQEHGIEPVDVNGDPIRRVVFASLRVASKNSRVHLAEGENIMSLDLVEAHSAEVYHRRYQNSAYHMRELGQQFSEIADTAEAFAREAGTSLPVVVRETGEVIGADIDPQQVQSALDGESDYGLASCVDPSNSPMPGNSPGKDCKDAFTACFRCPNAVITPRMAGRLATYVALTEDLRSSVSPPEWSAKYAVANSFARWALGEIGGAEVNLESPAIFDLGLREGPG